MMQHMGRSAIKQLCWQLNGSGGSRGCGSCHRNGSCLPRNASLKSESFLQQHHQHQRHQRRLQVADQKHGSKSSRVRHLRCKKKRKKVQKACQNETLGHIDLEINKGAKTGPDHLNDWKSMEILMRTKPGSLHLRSPAADCCSTRPLMKSKGTQHATSGRAHWYKLHQTSPNLLRLSPGLLGGRPADVPVVTPGMAIIRKLRVDAASSMHSLPGPVAVHLCSF